MTHYLVSTCMPKKNLEFMLNVLEKSIFRYDKEYCKKNKICSCPDNAGAMVREIKMFEIDIPTPASQDLEVFLSEWGFAEPFYKCKKQFNFMFDIIYRLFYKVMNFITQLTISDRNMEKQRWLNQNTEGTTYRVFSPMHVRFAGELPKPYKAVLNYNSRNLVLGKMIEFPVGSFERIPCKKCGAYISQH